MKSASFGTTFYTLSLRVIRSCLSTSTSETSWSEPMERDRKFVCVWKKAMKNQEGLWESLWGEKGLERAGRILSGEIVGLSSYSVLDVESSCLQWLKIWKHKSFSSKRRRNSWWLISAFNDCLSSSGSRNQRKFNYQDDKALQETRINCLYLLFWSKTRFHCKYCDTLSFQAASYLSN